MKSDRRLPVAIVGGGFSGTMVAAQLARRGIDVVLIEAAAARGRASLIRPRAGARAQRPRRGDERLAGRPRAFRPALSRPKAGRRRISPSAGGSAAISRASWTRRWRAAACELVEREAVCAGANDGWAVELDGGEPIEASALVLAIGNQPPEPMRVGRGSRALHQQSVGR